MNDGFHQRSYLHHELHSREFLAGDGFEEILRSWTDGDTIDSWRHRRFYQSLDPFLDAFPESRWLTVGDGRYGNDAHYIFSRGLKVLATDISDALLRKAKDAGYIEDCRKENAEALSFPDNSFDFVFCKEAYHHFPRPMVALYEMLRVAKKAVLLIEPNDPRIENTLPETAFRAILDLARILLRRKNPRHSYEASGNYVYHLSVREAEKLALGMSYRSVAFKGINDWYMEDAAREKVSRSNISFRKTLFMIRILDLLAKMKLRKPSLLAVAIFKEPINPELRHSLLRSGYDVHDLPANPLQIREESTEGTE